MSLCDIWEVEGGIKGGIENSSCELCPKNFAICYMYLTFSEPLHSKVIFQQYSSA